MVNWKLYIDSPQQRALDACYGSLTKGSGWGCGRGGHGRGFRGDLGDPWGDGWGDGYSRPSANGDGDYDDGTGDGWSATNW